MYSAGRAGQAKENPTIVAVSGLNIAALAKIRASRSWRSGAIGRRVAFDFRRFPGDFGLQIELRIVHAVRLGGSRAVRLQENGVEASVVDPGGGVTGHAGGETLSGIAAIQAESAFHPGDHPAILRRFQTAGREEDGAIRRQEGLGLADDSSLKRGDRCEGFPAESIFRFRTSRKDAGVRARDVQSEEIDQSDRLAELIRRKHFDGRVIRESSLQIGVADGIHIGGENHRIGECLSELTRLGTSSGTEIEDSLGLQAVGAGDRFGTGGILHAASRVGLEESLDSRTPWIEDEEAGSIVRRQGAVFLGFGADLFRIIGRDADRGPHQIVAAELPGLGHAMRADPMDDEVFAMAGLLFEPKDLFFRENGLVEDDRSSVGEGKKIPAFMKSLRVRVLRGERVLSEAGHLAEHGIDESCGCLMDMLTNTVDRLVDRGVVRNPIEQQEFGGPREQGGSNRWLEGVPLSIDLRGQHGLERDPPFQNRRLQGAGEGGVARRQPSGVRGSQRKIREPLGQLDETLVNPVSGIVLRDDWRRRLATLELSAWAAAAGSSIIHVDQEDTVEIASAAAFSAAALSVRSQVKVPGPPSPGSRPKWP